jgi:DNA-binding response OmpR family regulator
MSRRRILVAEDEAMIGLVLEDFLDILGHAVAGPCATMAECERILAEREPVDAAILDFNLLDGAVWPLARSLEARGVPMLFASGADPADVPGDLAHHPTLSKPYSLDALEQALGTLMLT